MKRKSVFRCGRLSVVVVSDIDNTTTVQLCDTDKASAHTPLQTLPPHVNTALQLSLMETDHNNRTHTVSWRCLQPSTSAHPAHISWCAASIRTVRGSVFCCDSVCGDQRLQMTSCPQRRWWGHLEPDRITDWCTEPWVNFSPPLTLSFRGKKKKENFHKERHLRTHFHF